MIAFALRPYLTRLARACEWSALETEAAQRTALRRLLRENAASELALRSGFSRVRSPQQMRDLPATDTDSFAGLLRGGLARGAAARAIIGRSSLVAFKQTSGTSGSPKLLPINAAYVASYRRTSLRSFAGYFFVTGRWAQLGQGKVLLLASRPKIGETSDGVPVGFSTGLMADRRPPLFRSLTLPSSRTLHLAEWSARLDRTLDEACGARIQAIAGMPRLIVSFGERLAQRRSGSTFTEAWPDLRILAFGGVALSASGKEAMRKLWGTGAPPPHFQESYAASEGFFGHTFDPQWPGMIFNALENFYQFKEKPDATTFTQLHELEPGKRYLVFVTTPGGLINYAMGDWIEVLSVRPLTFRVAGRINDEISLAGERLTGDQVELAIQRLERVADARIFHYVVWGEESPRRFVLGLCAPEGAAERANELARRFDESLGEVNGIYRLMRHNEGTFAHPAVRCLPLETFESYFARNLDRGQFKGRRLFRDEAAFQKEYLGHGSAPRAH